MTSGTPAAEVRRECARLSRYLTGEDPDPYVLEWYVEARRARPELFHPDGGVDRALAHGATMRWVPLRALDALGRFVAPACAVRRKLVLLGAVLESAPVTCGRFERPDVGSPAAFFLRAAWRGAGTAAAALLGLGLLPLLHVLRRVRTG